MDIFPFSPTPETPVRFSPILDGAPHQAEIVWSFFGQRWYLRLIDQAGELVIFTAVVGSGDAVAIDALQWDQSRQRVMLTTVDRHRMRLGSVASLTVSGSTPQSYSGSFLMTVEGPRTLSYPMPVDPGPIVSPGNVGRDINLVAGRFVASSMVYRESSHRFEVTP